MAVPRNAALQTNLFHSLRFCSSFATGSSQNNTLGGGHGNKINVLSIRVTGKGEVINLNILVSCRLRVYKSMFNVLSTFSVC